MRATAKLFGISVNAVRRIAKAYLEGGEAAVQRLPWGKGRPTKTHFFLQSEIDWMVSKATMTQQASMSLKARAL